MRSIRTAVRIRVVFPDPARLLLAAVLVLPCACRMDNPAYDPADHSGAGAGEGEAGETQTSAAESGASGASGETVDTDPIDTDTTPQCGAFEIPDQVCQGCVELSCCALAAECSSSGPECACFVGCMTEGGLPAACKIECTIQDTLFTDPLVECMLGACQQFCTFGGG